MKLGFTRSEAELNLYFMVESDRPLILVLYMDNLFLTGADPLIHQCKRELAFEFDMKDLGLMHYFLGLEVWKKPGDIFLSQGKYVVKILERFWMVDCKSVTTLMELNFKKLCVSVVRPNLGNPSKYRQLIGALIFLVNSPLDICFAVNTLSQFMVEPHHIQWIVAKNLLRNQTLVALSTANAEYIASSLAFCDAVWLRKLFSELFGHVLDTTMIFCDNQSGICLYGNPMFHNRSKHIDIRYHFIRDMVQWGAIRLHHIGIDE
eukprot:PITA_06448